jgi:preprotein translocase subunit SecG
MLLSPLKYWQVRHPVKRLWDIVLPGLAAVVLTVLLQVWPKIPSPFGAGGYLAGLQNLFAILGGFFVAALTLISTSESKALNQPLAGWPRVTFGNEKTAIGRRRFLCLLFGYLAFSCFGLYLMGFAAVLLAPGIDDVGVRWLPNVGSSAFLLVYNFWLSHMFVTTLVGLYYFTDRLQRPDAEREPPQR